MGRKRASMTRSELQQLLSQLPHGTQLPPEAVIGLLDNIPEEPQPSPVLPPSEPTWRERLWTAPANTRMGSAEVAEALGRPKSWVYRHTAPQGSCASIPHRKLDGELVFLVSEVRQWLEDHEEVVAQIRYDV